MPVGDGVDTIAVDTAQFYPVIAGTNCKAVQVIENPFGTATTDYYVVRRTTENPVTIKAGIDFIFRPIGGRRYYQPGEIVGYVKAVSGSMTMARMDQ